MTRTVDDILMEIARLSAREALGGDRADRERRRQQRVTQEIEATGAIATDDDGPAEEADAGAPTRGEPMKPTPPRGETEPEPEAGAPEERHPELPADSITPDVIADKLNIIRSGQSLKDSKVEDQMNAYIADLEDVQKVALFGYLKSIGQIVAGSAAGAAVKEPDEEPYDVRMRRLKDLEKRRETGDLPSQRGERFTTKQPEEREPVRRKSARRGEDTTAPIAVGRRMESVERQRLVSMLEG